MGRPWRNVLLAVCIVGCGGSGGIDGETIFGEVKVVSGLPIFAYAKTHNGQIMEAGVVVPHLFISDPPLGLAVRLDFPAEVQSTTALNHVVFQWEPDGHQPPPYDKPLFSVRGYTIPKAEVLTIQWPDPVAPAPERIPPQIVYPGTTAAVNQLGVRAYHALQTFFTNAALSIGFYNGEIVFFEMMALRSEFMRHTDHHVPLSRPAVFGRATRYPTRLAATYNPDTGRYAFKFMAFVDVE